MSAEYRFYDHNELIARGRTKTDTISNYWSFNKYNVGSFTVIIRIYDEAGKEPEDYSLPIEAKDIYDLKDQLKLYPEMAKEVVDKRMWENPPKAALQKTDASQKTDTSVNWTHIGAAFATGAVLATVVTVLVK
jgi:hypothetical protein